LRLPWSVGVVLVSWPGLATASSLVSIDTYGNLHTGGVDTPLLYRPR